MVKKCDCCGVELKDTLGNQLYCKNCSWFISKLKNEIMQLKRKLQNAQPYKNKYQLIMDSMKVKNGKTHN